MLYNGEKLPAKHIRGMAYEEAFGDTAMKAEYIGGIQTKKFFERLGFTVERYDKSVEELEKYDSWTIINDTLAVKKCDKSFFEYRGSGIPIDIRWFFGAASLKIEGDKVNINLVYENQVYDSYVSISKRESTPSTRMFWNTELGNLFNKFKPSDGEDYPEVEFERVGDNSYFVTFNPANAETKKVIDIDYIGVLDYLNENQEIPYSNPEAEGIAPDERTRLLAVKEKGQKAVGEIRKMARECEKEFKLDKCLPISWLDGSNTKTRRYLWAQMKYKDFTDDPSSISIFVEKNGDKGARYRISLELKNDGTDKKTIERYHTYLVTI